MTGEQALLLWTDAMKAIRAGDLAEAERIAKQMHVKSDATKVRENVGIEPEPVIREGKPTEEIHKLIEEDQDIAILVLAAGESTEGPGPLVTHFAGSIAGRLPCPLIIVPGGLSEEEIDRLS